MSKTALKAIIVEDDPRHAISLQDALTKLETCIQVAAVCTGTVQAYEMIILHKPELVFLDIELDRGENGFDLLKRFPEPDFSVIFTTQHNTNKNVVHALRASAFDFLTKAVKQEELDDAIKRYNRDKGKEQLKALEENTSSPEQWMKVLMIRTTEGLYRIEIDDIKYAASNGAYTTFHLVCPVEGKTEYLTSTRIGVWAETLEHSDMVRCHREWMINLKYASRFKPMGRGGYFTMFNSERIAVSESYRTIAESRFKSYRRR